MLKLAKRRALRRGDYVFRVGDVKRGAYLLTRGRLKFFRVTPDGREVIFWFCFPGEVFGISEVPAAEGCRVNVEACEDPKWRSSATPRSTGSWTNIRPRRACAGARWQSAWAR